MPSAGKSPEEWIGQKVVVEIIGARDYQMVARLDGIDDRGVVLAEGKPGESGEDAVFFPWNRVMAMRLARPDDEPPDYMTRRAQE